jgi:galactokinase
MGCAVLTALVELGDLDLPVEERPKVAQVAENDYVGAPTGIMDQSASILCRPGYALFLDCRTLVTEHVPFDAAAAGLAVLVLNTNAPHRNTDSQYAQRRRTCEEAAARLGLAALRDVGDLGAALAELPDEVSRRRVRHVVTENQRVLAMAALLRRGDVADGGRLLNESHASLRDDFEISWPEADVTVDTAVAAGALGARMMGGGFGGSVIALVPADSAAVRGAVCTAFRDRGWPEPGFLDAPPSASAQRLW